MKILKNRCLVMLLAMLMVPALYLLLSPPSGGTTILFVTAMLIIAWSANDAAGKKEVESEWIAPDKDEKQAVPCFLWGR